MVVQGQGIAEVKYTGMNTMMGKIGKELNETTQTPSELKKSIGKLVKKLTVIGASLCFIVVIVYTITRGSLLNGFLAGITLAMAMLPEEFPVVLSIFMAVGAWRISSKNVLTRNSSAIEMMGAITTLCTDKTGTLTKNKMVVSELFNKESYWNITEEKD